MKALGEDVVFSCGYRQGGRGLKLFCYVLLLISFFCGVVLWRAPEVVHWLLGASLVERQAELEIDSIHFGLRGVEVRLAHYVEPGFAFEGVDAQFPWGGLFGGLAGVPLRLECAVVRIELEDMPDSEAEGARGANGSLSEYSGQFAGFLERFSGELSAFPLGGLSASVAAVEVIGRESSVTFSTEVTLVIGESDTSVLAACVRSAGLSVDARCRIDGGGRALGLDFIARGVDWDAFSSRMLPEIGTFLKAKAIELSVHPLPGEGGQFAELSGYVRWSGVAPERARGAVFGDLGAIEFTAAGGACTTRAAAFGLVSDGEQVLRAHVSLPVETVQIGGWQSRDGDATVRLDGSTARGGIRFGEASVTFNCPSLTDLMEGSVELACTLQAKAVSETLFQAIAPGVLPPAIRFQVGMDVEGRIVVEQGQVVDASGHAQWAADSVQLPDQGLSIHGFTGSAQLESFVNGSASGQGVLGIDTLTLASVSFDQIETRFRLSDAGEVEVGGFSAQGFGGDWVADSFGFDVASKVSSPITIRVAAVDLAALVAAVPQFDGSLTGRVSGVLLLQQTAAGLRLKDGVLGLDEYVPARLSYSVGGLLTQGLVPGSAAHRQYRMAERALEDLRLKRFRIEFFPGGDESKPIFVTFYGESSQDGTIVPLDYTLNVNTDDSVGLIELLQRMQRGELDIQ